MTSTPLQKCIAEQDAVLPSEFHEKKMWLYLHARDAAILKAVKEMVPEEKPRAFDSRKDDENYGFNDCRSQLLTALEV